MIRIPLLVVLLFINVFAQAKPKKYIVIAPSENTIRIQNVTPIIKFWKSVCRDNQLDYTIDQYSIKKQMDEQTGEPFWILLGTSKNGCLSMAMQLIPSGEKLLFTEESINKGVVICKGDPKVCTTPGMIDGQWLCAHQCGPDCSKIVSVFYSEEVKDQLAAFLKEYQN